MSLKFLVAVQSTLLKRDPSRQASELLLGQIAAIAAGSAVEITASAPAANQQLQVTLSKPLNGATTWYAAAAQVQVVQVPPPELAAAADRNAVYQAFMAIQTQDGSDQNHLSFLDRGVAQSLYQADIGKFPDRLQQEPGQTIASPVGASFSAYPALGKVPAIDGAGLAFLHADIQQACVCIGSYRNGEMQARWLGKQALTTGQFWSATKIVPLLNVVCQANIVAPATQIDHCTVADPAGKTKIAFQEAATRIVNYQNGADDSNSLAGMFKRFSSLAGLETWWRTLSGNQGLQFRGYYGANPLIDNPTLQAAGATLLKAIGAGAGGENLVSAYDLTRLITMLGWHHHIAAKLPGAQWHSLEAIVRAMADDSARYIDVAIAKLGLQTLIGQPVIFSKLGFGASDSRKRTELTYTALVQFVDPLPRVQGKPATWRTIGMTLRAAVQRLKADGSRDLDEEARVIDSRMAAEVTELLRRIVTQELL